MKKLLLFSSLLALGTMNAQTTNVFNFGFDTAIPSTWLSSNQSSPLGQSTWVKSPYTLPLSGAIFGSGNTTTLPSGQAGGANSFAIVNFNSTTGSGTISNWLITPTINVKDGDIVSFYTRKGTDGTGDYADRLEVRYSSAATTSNPSGATGVGSFTNLGVTVNPNLLTGFVYPKVWTKYSFTISGVGTTEVPIKVGFRYFVTSGGPSGDNSDIIGLDTFSVDRPTLAVNDVSAVKTSIYPNPAKDVLNLKTSEGIKKVEIYDVAGRQVKTATTEKVNVSDLKAGMYIIKIQTASGETTEKFIKE